MIAELIFVGTELLLGETLNTNAQYLSQRLSELGIDCYHQVTVGDNRDRLAAAVRQALSRADIVITTGGLGPTQDDLTKETVAEVLGLPLELHQPSLDHIVEFFRQRDLVMSENTRKQALLPAGSRVIPNAYGTAPGMIAERGRRAVAVLPGPPLEMRPMFESTVVPYLEQRLGAGAPRLVIRTLKFCQIGESDLEQQLDDLIRAQTDPNIAPYAKLGEVHLRLSTKAASREAGLARIAPVEQAIRQRVGKFLFGADDETLEEVVGARLRQRGWTLALAESCTGGLLAGRITSVPGSSAYFGWGAVTYANEAKVAQLGVRPETLAAHGAVSAETALEMAAGARRRGQADLAAAVTGIAGPGGGTETKPVGTVYIGLDGPFGPLVRRFSGSGTRADIRQRSVQEALVSLWRYLTPEN